MRAIVMEDVGRVVLRDVADPVPGPGESLVRVSWSGICGTDVHGLAQGPPLRVPPLVMGHEFSGFEVRTGRRVVVNPRIVCDACEECASTATQRCRPAETLGVHRPGGFAEAVAVPQSALVAVPEGLDLRLAALTEPLAVARHAARTLLRHREVYGRRVAVIGGGLIGLGVAIQLSDAGAEPVLADVLPGRRAQAEAHGIPAVAALEGLFVATVEAVGAPVTRDLSLSHLAPGGSALWIGLDTRAAAVPVTPFVRSEQSIITSYCYTAQEFAEAVELCARFSVEELEVTTLAGTPRALSEDRAVDDTKVRTLIAVAGEHADG